MNNRQKLVQQQFLNNEKAVIKRLEYIYDQALSDTTKKIRELEFRIGELNEVYDWMEDDDPAKERIRSMIQSKVYQKQYQQAIQDQVEGVLKQMQTKEFLTVSDYLNTCYEDGFVGSLFDLHGQDVPLLMPLDQTKMVRAIQLDSKISKGLYTRLGEDVAVLKKKITAQVTRSIATGASYAQTAKQLAGISRIGYNNAVRIARTEGHRIQTTAAMDTMEAAKEKGADVVKQWDSTLDDATRESHVVVDGEIREVDKPFSNGLMFPGDPAGGAAEVINCRCALLQRARWALDEDELQTLKDRAAYFGLDKADQFDDFKKKYLKAVNEPVSVVPTGKDPVTLDMFPEYFRKNSASKKATQTFVDALNEAEGLDPNIRKLYTHIGDLPHVPSDCSISYTGKGHALARWTRGGKVTKCQLKVPKMQGDDLMGQRSTAFHEIGHFIDMGVSDNKRLRSELRQSLTDVVKSSGMSIGDDIKKLFDDFHGQYNTVRSGLQATYSAKRSALTIDVRAGKISWSDYKKQWNALIREEDAERDYQARNLCGGGVSMLSDIYDALSGGRYQADGTLKYGHGMTYYSDLGNRNCEIFANYMSLSVNRPDLVDMLRKDKPDLCRELDLMIEEMAGGI